MNFTNPFGRGGLNSSKTEELLGVVGLRWDGVVPFISTGTGIEKKKF